MLGFVSAFLFACLAGIPTGVARAEQGEVVAEPSPDQATAATAAEREPSEQEATPANFGRSYPVRYARRPLVLDEGMVRGDGRVTVGGVIGSGTFSALDLGGAVSPVENLELGLSTELIGSIPAPGGVSLIPIIFSPKARYGDIPVYGRYQFLQSDNAFLAVDLVFVLPTNTDFSITASLPLRVIELFGFVTLEGKLSIRYLNGDRYAAFTSDPSKNTAQFAYDGGASISITDHGFIEIGGGVALVNVGGGDGAKNVVEIPAYAGGGYTHEGKVLVDVFAQFGFQPLMTAGGPTGRDTFNVADDWYVTLGATVHTKELFGKNDE